MDGVFVPIHDNNQRFVELIPTNEEIRILTLNLYKRINRAFEKKGYLDSQGELALIKSQSMANQVSDFEYPEKIGMYWNPRFIEFEGE